MARHEVRANIEHICLQAVATIMKGEGFSYTMPARTTSNHLYVPELVSHTGLEPRTGGPQTDATPGSNPGRADRVPGRAPTADEQTGSQAGLQPKTSRQGPRQASNPRRADRVPGRAPTPAEQTGGASQAGLVLLLTRARLALDSSHVHAARCHRA